MTFSLEEIKKFWADSSPGAWVIRRMKPMAHMPEKSFIMAPRANPKDPYDIELLGEDDTLYPTREADLKFIAAAHCFVPELIAEIERLRLKLGPPCICTRIPSNDWHLEKCPRYVKKI